MLIRRHSISLLLLVLAMPATSPAKLPLPDETALEYFRYVGGATGNEYAAGCAVDPDGNLYVAGATTSTDLPTTQGAYQRTATQDDIPTCYLAKVDPSGANLVYLTYFGSTGYEDISDVTVDESGAAYVIGRTESDDLPIVNGLQSTRGGDQDVFLAKFDPSGSQLLYSTYLGSSRDDYAYDIVYAGNGRVWLCGYTGSPTFPTTPDAYVPSVPIEDYNRFVSFVTEIDTNVHGAASLQYSTLFRGGMGADASSITVDEDGLVYVVGGTSVGLPTTPEAYVSVANGLNSAFLCVFDATKPGAEGLVYCSYIAPVDCYPKSVQVHDGLVYIAGYTGRGDFPTTENAVQPTLTNPAGEFEFESFLLVMDPSRPGTPSLQYATYFGGLGIDDFDDMAVDDAGNAWLVGQTNSAGLPRTRDAVGRYEGLADGMIVCISPTLDATEGLRYCSYLGGTDNDALLCVVADDRGGVFLAGLTGSSDIPLQPTTGGPQPGAGDDLIVRLQSPVTDVSMTASTAMPSPAPLDGLTSVVYDIANVGPSTAFGAALVVDLPPHTSIARVIDENGTSVDIPSTSGRVRIPAGTLGTGRSAALTVTYSVEPDADAQLSFAARAVSATVDTSRANNDLTTFVEAVVYPTVSKVKTVTDATGAFTIIFKGSDFRPGLLAYVGSDLVPWPRSRLKGTTKVTLSGGGLKARFPKGVAVTIRLVNSDNSSVSATVIR